MGVKLRHPLQSFLRKGMIPHIWCKGCGNGIILNCFVKALDELNIDLNKVVVVSGIGCIGRISGYTNTDSFHTTHGRPIAFATGVKLAKPELKVVVISGDGDLFAIGGNHFIHAARRNMDIQVICANNFNYGMTGGQHGPTTPLQALAPTTPYGNIEHPFNLVHLAAGSGAVYVARWTVFHVRRLIESIKKALQKEGFSFIEAVTPCTEIYGQYNKMGTAIDMMRWLMKTSEIRHHYDPVKAEITPSKIIVGEFVDIEKPGYNRLLREMIAKVHRKEGEHE
ncbi:MAG: thiamine pyrophosphate-dependent enzyme [Candidatus Bathyarchaeota archaeon]|nr:thiamine pyrophosphate-dependent enzyme [Candidatus Bathyarchaeota archaeon]MDH5624240.1 thiamine pyrophosphate-dependent enzyme [Candidatus Bathyarchaeota archaeon]MDH5636781.1 thiamine pyrophosphate-dependent enzyme [Candidatus Bathyarchaeota archaeon]MDH5702559.1 thiamine pyrophosphate-dependent enzyme [Candidatus Bathyarchaeota archaeon]